MEQLQHLWSVAYGYRRKAATWGLFLFAGLLAVHVVFGTNGWMAYQQKKDEYRKVTQEVEKLQQDNDQLRRNIDDLKNNPQAIARQARETLHYARPDEVVIYLPQPRQDATATAQAKNENTKK